ncbi:MAG TPA: phosphate ABC transporter permease PstA [Polyangiaceae bacterium]|nr:phosphate ABC transporter permease PstA [Polyangiaceae bacterium]
MTATAARSAPLVIATRRKASNVVMLGLCIVATTIALAVLAWIFGYVLVQGARFVSLSFFTKLPVPVGESGGGFLNALIGTGIMVGVASAISIPIGIFAGIYLSEFGTGWFAGMVRFVNDTLNATPSIVAGLFAYTLIVLQTRRFSAFAGSVALAVLMIPTITRTAEEMIRLVPRPLREAALALGIPEWRMTLQIVLPAAASGVITGVMLAVARVSGETAALLFTAFNNRFLSAALDEPMSSVPVQVYTYAIAPYDDWHHQAWAGALVLVTLVAVFSAAVRIATRNRHRSLG